MSMKTSTIKSVLNSTLIKQTDVDAIVQARHGAAHTILGLRVLTKSAHLVISAFIPDADSVTILDKRTQKQLAVLTQVDEAGFFVAKLRRKNQFAYQLKVTCDGQTKIIDDAFAYSADSGMSILGEMDIHLLNEGNHQKPYQKLGAHSQTLLDKIGQKIKGVAFSLWAPNASSVAVIGDFNLWDGRLHPMENIVHHGNRSGYWTIFIPDIELGSLYKFELKDSHGNVLANKADPFASQAQYRPDTACIVSDENEYPWQDAQWLAERAQRNARNAAISIYEVHLGSWQRDENNQYLNYRTIADKLIPYTLEMGFTHIQLMPVSEFPFDGSWGYQPVGLFSPSSRFGSREDFQYFVDQCHQANLGLLIDWVPGHFPSDPHGLAQFDGSHLYEHADPRQGYHPDWNTLIYNYGRVEVANFLRASALHWLDTFHVDGIRVDAVASMLYLDYSRKEGEWLPNIHGGRENLEAIELLQQVNSRAYFNHPGVMMIAEESTAWPGVSKPVDGGGLGFGFKWNMGWMNDTLKYMERDPIHRQHHHNEMTFGLVYSFSENFVLPLSHDEVVHGKGSLLNKMPGDDWQKFANLRAYYGFMWTHPGKKLLFMGCEFAQRDEWNHDQSLDWHSLQHDSHKGVLSLIKDLNHAYKNIPALYELDCDSSGFEWLDSQNSQQSILVYLRKGKEGCAPALVVVNLTPTSYENYCVGVPLSGYYRECLNTDSAKYGGSNVGNGGGVNSVNKIYAGQANQLTLSIPPLSTMIFEWQEND